VLRTAETLEVPLMKTSAGNFYDGIVLNIYPGTVNNEVEIALTGSNTRMTAVIASSSVKILGLEPGKSVVVLVKAQWVILADSLDGVKFSASNQLHGTVVSIKSNSVNAEVNMRLDGGESLTATSSASALKSMGIEAGQRLVALIKGSRDGWGKTLVS
jgi:molybdate transport system regulatory protein